MAYQVRRDCVMHAPYRLEVTGELAPVAHALAQRTDGAQDIMSMLWTWGYVWADNAFPVLDMGHKAAATCMSSVVERAVEVRAPWAAFLLAVPSGLVFMSGKCDQPVPVYQVCVRYDDGKWSYSAMSEHAMLHRADVHQSKLCKAYEDAHGIAQSSFLPLMDMDARAEELLGHYILSACLFATGRKNLRRLGTNARASRRRPRPQRDDVVPKPVTFVLSVPVTIDCSAVVREYALGTGTGKAPSVNWMVRGHWRNQPHGPGNTLRRLKWIAPHWGNLNAEAIAVRPHVIKAAREIEAKPEGTV